MTRKSLEQKIINDLKARVENYGFELGEVDFSSKFNHTVDFVKSKGNLTFIIKVKFMKPNFIKIQMQFLVFSAEINEALAEYVPFYLEQGFPLINFDIDEYFSQLFNEEKRSLYITGDGGLDSVNISEMSEIIFENYFASLEANLISKIDSISNIEQLINQEKYFIDGEISLSEYCFPEQFQIISGSLLAIICKKDNSKLILNRYLNYSQKEYTIGEDKLIDGYWNYLNSLASPSL